MVTKDAIRALLLANADSAILEWLEEFDYLREEVARLKRELDQIHRARLLAKN